MVSATVQVPAELRREFRQFRADFEAVWQQWMDAGEETPDAYARAKEQAAQWISDNAEGAGAEERLRAMFAYWSELRSRVAPLPPAEVAVVPGMSECELGQMLARRSLGDHGL